MQWTPVEPHAGHATLIFCYHVLISAYAIHIHTLPFCFSQSLWYCTPCRCSGGCTRSGCTSEMASTVSRLAGLNLSPSQPMTLEKVTPCFNSGYVRLPTVNRCPQQERSRVQVLLRYFLLPIQHARCQPPARSQ